MVCDSLIMKRDCNMSCTAKGGYPWLKSPGSAKSSRFISWTGLGDQQDRLLNRELFARRNSSNLEPPWLRERGGHSCNAAFLEQLVRRHEIIHGSFGMKFLIWQNRFSGTDGFQFRLRWWWCWWWGIIFVFDDHWREMVGVVCLACLHMFCRVVRSSLVYNDAINWLLELIDNYRFIWSIKGSGAVDLHAICNPVLIELKIVLKLKLRF